MQGNIYIYILVMAVVTYLIRMLPLALIRKKISNRFLKSFLYYVPYVTLAVMVFPAIITCTDSRISAVIGFSSAIISGYLGGNLITVSTISCLSVFISELIIF